MKKPARKKPSPATKAAPIATKPKALPTTRLARMHAESPPIACPDCGTILVHQSYGQPPLLGASTDAPGRRTRYVACDECPYFWKGPEL